MHLMPCSLLVAMLFALAAADASKAADAKSDPLRILFIGNSYTSVNDLPAMLRQLAAAGNQRRLDVASATPGGFTWQRHVDDENSAAKGLLDKGPWDYVVMQEQSQMPFAYPKQSREYGIKLGEMVKAKGAKPVLYLTWAREKQPENQAKINETYEAVAAALQCPIAPVGMAWEKARDKRKDLALFNKDGSHPSPAGTYLAACVMYAALFDKPPRGLPAKLMTSDGKRVLVQLTMDDASLLQELAWETVTQMREKKVKQ